MQSKEEIENILNKCNNCNLSECINCEMSYTERQKVKKYIEQLESDFGRLIEENAKYYNAKCELIEKLEEKEKLNDKYLQKLVYSLSPTTHSLGDSYNNAFKKIIADNIDLETCKIKKELKNCWEGRF